MDFVLSWDLVMLIILSMCLGYNFLLGQSATIKLILSTYIAILASDGIIRIIQDFIIAKSPGLQSIIGDGGDKVFLYMKLAIFLTVIIIFVLKGGFHIHLKHHKHWGIRALIHFVFSVLSAFLFLGTILICIAGSDFAHGVDKVHNIVIYRESFLARILIDYYQIWFSLPAICFLLTSFIFPKDISD